MAGLLTFNPIYFNVTGCIFYGKQLYVAFAQRKEDRVARLKAQYAQGIAGPSTAFTHGGYTPYYYATGVVPQLQHPTGLVYQPMGMRPGWRLNGFAPPTVPVQQALVSVVSSVIAS